MWSSLCLERGHEAKPEMRVTVAMQLTTLGRLSTMLMMNGWHENARFFRYCPQCGSGNFGFRSEKLLKCDDCSFEFYVNPAAAVAAMVVDGEGRLLVTVRGKEPAKGMWDLPGGFIDPQESAEDGLRREVKEELGLDIVSAEYLCSAPNVYEYMGIRYNTVDIAYLCLVKDVSQARALDDVASIVWVKPEEIDPAKFGFESMRQILARFVETRGSAG